MLSNLLKVKLGQRGTQRKFVPHGEEYTHNNESIRNPFVVIARIRSSMRLTPAPHRVSWRGGDPAPPVIQHAFTLQRPQHLPALPRHGAQITYVRLIVRPSVRPFCIRPSSPEGNGNGDGDRGGGHGLGRDASEASEQTLRFTEFQREGRVLVVQLKPSGVMTLGVMALLTRGHAIRDTPCSQSSKWYRDGI